jgi:hypothetical protein
MAMATTILSTPTHRIKRGAGIWDTTPDSGGGTFRTAQRWLEVEMTDNRPDKIFDGDFVEFLTADGRTVWADNESFVPIA